MKSGDLVGDRFEIHELAGAGAMGLVYRAEDRQTGAVVALKVLRPGAETERFGREARLLAELHHPGIVRYVAHGSSAEGSFLAMEWLEGMTLAERLECAELSLAESMSVLVQVASAIGAAHRRLIVHRDLKPSNVFLCGSEIDRVKVMDFGVARQGTLSSELTQTGAIVGSPRYMSPEQASGKRELMPTSDVWALGVLAFRCFTGRFPFDADGMELLLSEILLGTPRRLRDVVSDMPAALDELVHRMLSRDPSARPTDGEEVAAELLRLDFQAAPGLSQRIPERHALTREEQRFTCVIAVRASAALERSRRVASAFGAGVLPIEPELAIVVLSERGTTAGDLAIQAARCALALSEELADAAIALVMGAGQATDRTRSDRTLAARAERLLGEQPPGVTIDDTAVGLLESRFEIDGAPGARRLLKERREVTPVRRLLGRATPCVGRNRELAALLALWDECKTESVSRVALVTGAAGVGKSRLRYELLRAIEAKAGQVWIGRGNSASRGAPFGILADALRPALGVQLGVAAEEQRARIAERVGQHVAPSERRRVSCFLAELVGVGGDPSDPELSAAEGDPVLLGDQIRAAWEDFVEAETSHGPVLLILEDLQWGDWPTLKLVDSVLRQFSERPLLAIGFGRPEVADLFPGLWVERGVQGIALGELPRKAAERLVREVLGDRISAERVQAIVERAMGNAFFLEELIRAAAERPDEDSLPPSVLAMAQARVQALDPDARRLLRAASIFGAVFWRGGVETLLGGPKTFRDLDAWLELLIDRELVTPRKSSRIPQDGELTFRHALLRDAAYTMLTDEDRKLGHRLAAEWLESKQADAMEIAEHHQLGQRPDRAARLWLRVAEQALEGDDFDAALGHAERALDCGLPEDSVGEAHWVRAMAHHWRGDFPQAELASAAAMQHLPKGSSRWYAAAALEARIASRLGRDDRLEPLIAEVARDQRPETAPDRATVLSMIGVPAVRAGRAELALRVFELVLRVESALSDDGSARNAMARGWLERLRGYRALVDGDSAAYLRHTEAAVELLRRGGDRRSALTFATSVGYALLALGQHASAERVLRETLAGADRLGLGTACTVAKHNLGYAVAMLGRMQEGIAIERAAIADAQRFGDRWTEGACWSYLADLLLHADRPAEAEHAALQANELAAAASRPMALALLARARLRQGDLAEALEASREARRLLDELGSIEDGDALVRLIHAETLEAAGEREAAKTAFEAARARLLERAARIGEKELRQSFLANVPEHAATLSRLRG